VITVDAWALAYVAFVCVLDVLVQAVSRRINRQVNR